ncbi:MAG: motility protein A [Oscillospiraceae bacterium]|nr:motility protein A [Oscillospiraceae bacterium]
MDILSVMGLIAAAGFIIYGITGGGAQLSQITNFFVLSGVAITVGGTFAALMLMFPVKVFASLPKMLAKIFKPQKFNLPDYIAEVVTIAHEARKNGILSLEEKLPAYKDEFMRKGLQLAVDSTDPDTIRDIMETELGFMIERHNLGIQFFEKGAALAPGFGLLGTLVGLINMLATLDNPNNLTKGMAVALVTTFYGSLLSNVVFLPMGNKLQKRSDEEVLCKQIIIEGVVAIANGESPKQIQEKLLSYVPPAMRDLYRVG